MPHRVQPPLGVRLMQHVLDIELSFFNGISPISSCSFSCSRRSVTARLAQDSTAAQLKATVAEAARGAVVARSLSLTPFLLSRVRAALARHIAAQSASCRVQHWLSVRLRLAAAFVVLAVAAAAIPRVPSVAVLLLLQCCGTCA